MNDHNFTGQQEYCVNDRHARIYTTPCEGEVERSGMINANANAEGALSEYGPLRVQSLVQRH